MSILIHILLTRSGLKSSQVSFPSKQPVLLMCVCYVTKKFKKFTSYMVWLICTLVLVKTGLMNNYLVLFISNIVLFSNILKAILCIILYKNKMKISEIFLFFFSFVSLSNWIYFIVLKLKYLCPAEGTYFTSNFNILLNLSMQIFLYIFLQS